MYPIHQKYLPFLAPTISFALCIGSSVAAPITVNNFSFESPDITNQNVTAVPTGWTAPNGATGVGYRDNYAGLAAAIPDGNQWAKITFTAGNKSVTLAQDTTITIVEGVTYSLTVAVGEQENQAATDNIARIFLYGSTTGETAPFALLDDIDPIPDANMTAGDDSIWMEYTASFTATAAQAGQSLVIGLGAGSNIGNTDGWSTNVSFDNVRLYAATIPSGAPLVYEPFDYTPTDGTVAVVGLNGGTGFSGAWTGAGTFSNNVVGSGLSFGGLDSAGGSGLRSSRAGSGAISRTITGPLQAALTADNSTIWFSVLMDPTGGDGYAINSYGTLIFGDTAFTSASGSSAPALPGGNAFGVGFVGEQAVDPSLFDFSKVGIQGVAYNGGTLSTAGDATVEDLGDVTSFIVGRIDFAPNGSDDTLTLYRVTDPTLDLPALPFATLTADLDQSGFNVVSIGDAQTSIFDEIRIGTSFADVVGFISSATPGLAITSFTSVGAGVWEVELSGEPNGQCVFYSDTDLVFDPGSLVVNLTQGANGTVGGLNNSVLTLDGTGIGVVQLTLSGNPRDFIRAQTAP